MDLSKLVEVGDAIRFADLGLDTEKYEISIQEDAVIVSASAPKVVEEEEPEAAAEGEGETAEGEEATGGEEEKSAE